MMILIDILVLMLLVGCAIWVVDMMPLPPPIKMVARVILGIAALLWLLNALGLLRGHALF